MRIIHVITATALLMLSPAEAQTHTDKVRIEGFTVADKAWTNTSALSVCCDFEDRRLDQLDTFTQSLSVGLSANPAIAEAQALAIFEARQTELKTVAEMQSETLRKTLDYRIDRFPALVFNDGEAVIYGVTDLRQALQIFQSRRP